MTKIRTASPTDGPVGLTPDVLFGASSITLLMLYTLAMTGHPAETRTRAMQALLTAVLPAVLMAVDVVLVPQEISGTVLEQVVHTVMTDLQRAIPTWSVRSGRQLMRQIAAHILMVLANGPRTGAVNAHERPPHAGDLVRLLHPTVRAAVLLGLYPRLDAGDLEVLLRMSQPDATWTRVAVALRTSPEALRRHYALARSQAEGMILDEITRRQTPTVMPLGGRWAA